LFQLLHRGRCISRHAASLWTFSAGIVICLVVFVAYRAKASRAAADPPAPGDAEFAERKLSHPAGKRVRQHDSQAANVQYPLGATGGWEAGSQVYWADYLSMTNDQELAATPGTEYAFDGQTEIDSRSGQFGRVRNLPPPGGYAEVCFSPLGALETLFGQRLDLVVSSA
jgi:hypothetical protein